MKWKKGLFAMAAAVLILAVAACGGNNAGNNGGKNNGGTASAPPAENGGTTVDAAAAEAIYKANCVSCHAVDLSGGVGPSLKKTGAKLSVDQIHTTISNGRGGMPAYQGKLTDEEIMTLAAWLAEKK